jgi:hypothetical protein
VPEDDRAVMERLAALEAEVKADAEKQRAHKEAALAKLREQRAAQQPESDALRKRQQALVVKKKPEQDEESDEDALGGALSLAKKANRVKQELAKKGEKSWVKSGLASAIVGPIGWLYAGSFREAIPASLVYLTFAAIASKLPVLFIMPVWLIAMVVSGIAGVMYAVQFNRTGKRQRLFNRNGKTKPKQLRSG